MALDLDFKPDLRFSGSAVEGSVSINLNEARSQNIRCVRVKLRGAIDVHVNQYTGYSVNPIPGHQECLRQDLELWRPGTSFPSQGDVLTLPFTFTLPQALPPSNATDHSLGRASCRYYIQAVGDRPGTFKRNRRKKQAFPLLPDDAAGWRVKQQLQQNNSQWHGDWAVKEASDRVRRALWQDYSYVQARLHLPAVAAFPLSTAIPFKLELRTTTRPLKEKELHKKESSDGHVFPYPPDMSNVKFTLVTRHHVETDHSLSGEWTKTQDLCKGLAFGDDRTEPQISRVRGDQDKFEIYQSNTATGTVVLNTTAPSYDTRVHTVTHELVLKVPFSGLTNNVSLMVPIEVTSGCSVQDAEHAEYEMLPSYYDVADSDDDKDDDEKGEKKFKWW